jgi:alpha-beta hydrolase superfamily lysophospholipase
MPTPSHDGAFTSRDGLKLYYRRWDGASPTQAVLVVVHGYLEHSGRYQFLADFFAPKGYRLYAMDLRGHGQSGGRRAYVGSFGEYLDDLDRFLSTIQEREGDGLKFLVGHSLGGLISLRYAIQSPEGLAGLVVSSPYLANKVPISPLKLYGGRLLSRVLPTLAMDAGLKTDLLSHDAEVVRAHDQDPLVQTRFTTRWATETLAAQEEVLARAGELRLPCLVLQGGDDQVADPTVSHDLFQRLTVPDKEWIPYGGYYHEVFNEVGRERVFGDLAEWLRGRR